MNIKDNSQGHSHKSRQGDVSYLVEKFCKTKPFQNVQGWRMKGFSLSSDPLYVLDRELLITLWKVVYQEQFVHVSNREENL